MPTTKKLEDKAMIEQKLRGKDFLTLAELETEDILFLLEEAIDLKQKQKQGIPQTDLQGKTLGMIFEKSSTRTRVSFEVGMLQLGGHAIFLSSKDIQLGRGESIHDTAKVLSRYVNGIMIRTFEHEKVEELAEHATIPVINGLTDLHHPAQVLADLLTILEHKGKLKGLKLCYIGDGNNNVAHSLIEGAAKVGMNIAIASPNAYEPNADILKGANADAEKQNSSISFTNDPIEAVKDADVVVTDVWASMGQEDEQEERINAFKPFQVNSNLCKHAKDDFIFLHCLPAHREEEVTAEIIDGTHSVVFDEAENRLHAQKALLKVLMKD
ncbi:ornithine carbamoyltransferase [Evansella cellulosilytica]|uniref:Ornithine carbamoyltransferase n=1 Tax=Evansella cellulosilytica (strain ATCC 21833 / DSM 2522 / FERM P-1141 / JCM 9156 / N-4) TaxID=649639 RepID=E6TYY3_EVAC2|nr:ornithine carbamoyltransferase [Evansella cellulosilytica]ADU32426.1 ornithine carbamoyltransferase [Evansella cellulosilytica DSM 2522]